MIKQLKKKFILITMSLITVVLVAVFIAVSTINKVRVNTDSFLVVEKFLNEKPGNELQRNTIKGPNRDLNDSGQSNNSTVENEDSETDKSNESIADEFFKNRDKGYNGKRNMEFAPIFSVTVDQDGNILSSQFNFVSISDVNLHKAIENVIAENELRGELSSQNLLYIKKVNSDNSIKIVFSDQTNNKESLKHLMRNLLVVEIFAFLVFWGISYFLASMAIKPVEKAWENERQFLGDASHELKTPLTVILTNLSILSSNRNLIDKSQHRWIKNSNDEALRMKELIDQMLFLAKNDSYGIDENKIVMEDINISEILMESTLTMESLAYERNIEFVEDIEADLEIKGNSSQIKQLVNILLDNACKYAEKNTRVLVKLWAEKSTIRLSVNNKGSYISPEEREKLFDRFYRSEKSRVRKEGGYGLGLTIAQSIAKAHGGKIDVQSSIEDGTTFTVTLGKI